LLYEIIIAICVGHSYYLGLSIPEIGNPGIILNFFYLLSQIAPNSHFAIILKMIFLQSDTNAFVVAINKTDFQNILAGMISRNPGNVPELIIILEKLTTLMTYYVDEG
jgi:hypothetical protein